MRWRIVLVLFIVFNILDAYLTVYALKTGLFYEANPITAAAINWAGLFGAFILTKGASCGCGVILFTTIKKHPWTRWALLLVTIGMLFVVVHSIYLLASTGQL